MKPDPWARLAYAAWIALAVHLLAGAAMATLLRPGLQSNPDLNARLAYLIGCRGLWIAGWLCWNAAAASILYFFFAFAEAYGGCSSRFALVLACAAVAADVSAEALEMGLMPELAARALADPSGRALFLAFDRAAVLLTGYFANGLYTAAAGLAAAAAWREHSVWTRAAAVAVVLAGAGLSAAALDGSTFGMMAANVVLLPALLLWLAGAALAAGLKAARRRGP